LINWLIRVDVTGTHQSRTYIDSTDGSHWNWENRNKRTNDTVQHDAQWKKIPLGFVCD